jgi:Fic family protein
MLDMLGGNPFVTPRGAEKHLGLAYNTVMRAIGQLENHGIIKEVSGAKRDRAYCAQKLLVILEEPAQLSPAGKF